MSSKKTDLIIRDQRLIEADRLHMEAIKKHWQAEALRKRADNLRSQAVSLQAEAEAIQAEAEAEAKTGAHYMVFYFALDLVIGHNFTGSELTIHNVKEIEIIHHGKYPQLTVYFDLEKNPLFHIDSLHFTLSDIYRIQDHSGGKYKLTEV